MGVVRAVDHQLVEPAAHRHRLALTSSRRRRSPPLLTPTPWDWQWVDLLVNRVATWTAAPGAELSFFPGAFEPGTTHILQVRANDGRQSYVSTPIDVTVTD